MQNRAGGATRMTAASTRGRPPRPAAGARVQSAGSRLGPMVYDLIKERLLDGGYRAGERVAVEPLKLEFEVSKQPIMEALRRLATEGLVEIIPQVGCRVPVYSGQDVADFFALFAGLEGAVAGVAAQRRDSGQLDELVRINTAIARLADGPEPAVRAHGYRVLNREFHAGIHAMAHSRVVSDISRRMWDLSDLLINTGGVAQPLATAVLGRHRDHEQIIAALREHNHRRARAVMEAHIIGTVEIITAGDADRNG